MRIAHLSDLHLSPDHFPDRTDAFYEILQKCKTLDVDHIIITGDITNQAKPKEFAHARSILKEFRFLDPEKLTVTIGNHDIYGGPYYAEDVLTFPRYCSETNYDAKLKEFHSSFHESFDGCQYINGKSIFPFVKIIKGIAFVGINSVARWNAWSNPLGSNGEIDPDEFRQLKGLFESDMLKKSTVLVLIHHHFNKTGKRNTKGKLDRLWHAIEMNTMKLKRKKRLFKLFANAGVGKVLHGHMHQHATYERRNIEFFNAGGTMLMDHQDVRRFHLLQVHGKGVEHTNVIVPDSKKIRKALLQTG